ncbi:hypothetical protein BpHYR1_043249 [Brachionus plicatilis]|uniref:Uncharacterized protein n=1 Tax=Brachionus plicatilis TaxID=10195 RepID=A0A3M7QHB2_BRAPC|nr:hypothetical protein BpHYR1_043249 [Brachionus plicatilis]
MFTWSSKSDFSNTKNSRSCDLKIVLRCSHEIKSNSFNFNLIRLISCCSVEACQPPLYSFSLKQPQKFSVGRAWRTFGELISLVT